MKILTRSLIELMISLMNSMNFNVFLIIFSIEFRVGNSTDFKSNPLCNWITNGGTSVSGTVVECSSVGRFVTISSVGSSIPLTLCNVNVLTSNNPSNILCLRQNEDNRQLADGYLILNGKCYKRQPQVNTCATSYTRL